MKIGKELKIACETLDRIEKWKTNSIKDVFEKIKYLVKIRKLIKVLEKEK